MWIGRFGRAEISPEPTPVDLSDVHVEEDPWAGEWVFKGQPSEISKAIRVQYRWLKDESQGIWVTDYLLIGYGGYGEAPVQERESDRTATRGTVTRRLLSSLSVDPRFHILGLLGLLLIFGFAWLSSSFVSSVLSRADAIDDAQFAMYSLISETSQRAFIACASSAPLPDAAWNVTTSRTAMAFPPVPEAVSTSITIRPVPRQARPGNDRFGGAP
jgi:hypothetical protein